MTLHQIVVMILILVADEILRRLLKHWAETFKWNQERCLSAGGMRGLLFGFAIFLFYLYA